MLPKRMLPLLFLLVLMATPAMAHGQSHGFNFDLAVGKVMPNAKNDDMADLAAFRVDYRPSDCFVVSGGVTRAAGEATITEAIPAPAPPSLWSGGHTEPTPTALTATGERTVNLYDYQLQISLESHFLGDQKFDPYVSAGVGAHRVDVEGAGNADYTSWHVGIGLDLHLGDEVGLAFDSKLARPFDQDDGEEYIELTVGLTLGGN